MTRLTWDNTGERKFETGIDNCVLYPSSGNGVAWSGIVSIDEQVFGGEPDAYYFDGEKYLDVVGHEDFQAILTAFQAPQEFTSSDGYLALAAGLYATQQSRSRFGLCYRTLIGNDINGSEHGYKLHLVYNALATPTTRSNKTQSANSVEANQLQWTINAVPPTPASATYKATAHLVIDSTLVDPNKLAALESLLYGQDLGSNASLPNQQTVIATLT